MIIQYYAKKIKFISVAILFQTNRLTQRTGKPRPYERGLDAETAYPVPPVFPVNPGSDNLILSFLSLLVILVQTNRRTQRTGKPRPYERGLDAETAYPVFPVPPGNPGSDKQAHPADGEMKLKNLFG